ncbi:disulfide bond formation protein B [Microbulbifer rhizosphaerae]|uniref:Disulfide bond formation protein DsbB n=1 Tax=Microbulbifer rhizosphaerae TaxID=1562603 RepID=A0A7W4WDD0_9GAMM|nr:disulfide bond formation protein B [Microbulbifer rhizosphaerae]MBB3061643.1 disulfide bond formation protein DsbB [Microbulbifer rhizosphaerae]
MQTPRAFSPLRTADALALLGVSGILWFALIWQLWLRELPCPLCLLQRVAFLMVGIGLLLNLRCGPRPLHYTVILVSALGGLLAAGRQVLLHIAPGDPGFGSPFLGLHFYTWAFIAFSALLLYAAVTLALEHFEDAPPRALSPLANLAAVSFLVIALINLVSTTLECSLGPCPDNPTEYQLLGR